MTSPLRTRELPNPDGRLDDAKPGVDVSIDRVNALADYTRLVVIDLAHDNDFVRAEVAQPSRLAWR